jgi:hypothetical protein
MIPVPNFSGWALSFFSIAYAMKEAMVAPAPGRTPMKKPRSELRPMGPSDAFQSSRLGNRVRRLSFVWMNTCLSGASRLSNTSATAKSLTATPMKPNPSSR